MLSEFNTLAVTFGTPSIHFVEEKRRLVRESIYYIRFILFILAFYAFTIAAGTEQYEHPSLLYVIFTLFSSIIFSCLLFEMFSSLQSDKQSVSILLPSASFYVASFFDFFHFHSL